MRGPNNRLALTAQIEKAPLVVGQRVRKSGFLDRGAAKFKGAMRGECEAMSKKFGSEESGFQACGTGLYSALTFAAAGQEKSVNSFLENIFAQELRSQVAHCARVRKNAGAVFGRGAGLKNDAL